MKRILSMLTIAAVALFATAAMAQTAAPAPKPSASVEKVTAAPVAAAQPVAKASDPQAAAEKICREKNLAGAAYDECMKAELAKNTAAKPPQAQANVLKQEPMSPLHSGKPADATPAAKAEAPRPAAPAAQPAVK